MVPLHVPVVVVVVEVLLEVVVVVRVVVVVVVALVVDVIVMLVTVVLVAEVLVEEVTEVAVVEVSVVVVVESTHESQRTGQSRRYSSLTESNETVQKTSTPVTWHLAGSAKPLHLNSVVVVGSVATVS